MENVINVNIGGVSFTLNSEAYAILEKYLNELSNHYKSKEYGAEIMDDIESRIAELLLEKFSKEEVVNSERIDEVIAIMGKPSDYYAGEDEDAQESKNAANSFHRDAFSQAGNPVPVRKRLHRDVDNKFLGGVCSGFGHFFNVDPTWVRIGLVALLIVLKVAHLATPWHFELFHYFYRAIIVAYIIFWIFVPAARTYTQKCEMIGHDPGVKGAEGIKGSAGFYPQSEPSPLENVFRWCIGIVMILLGFGILIYGLILGLGVASGVIPSVLAHVEIVSDIQELMPSINSLGITLLTISSVLIWIIPCILLIYEGIRVIGRFNSPNWHPGIVLFVLWLLSVIGLVLSVFYVAKNVEDMDFNELMRKVDPDCEVIVDTTAAEDYDNTYIIEADSVSVIQQDIISADSTVVK